MKRTICLSLTFVFVFLLSTCKKIEKNSFDMSGFWYTKEDFCYTYLNIKASGFGIYSNPNTGWKGCDHKFTGKVRFNRNHLYIGVVKFHFVEKPQVLSGTDSLEAGGVASLMGLSEDKFPKLAKMTLKKSFLHGSETCTYYKLIDY